MAWIGDPDGVGDGDLGHAHRRGVAGDGHDLVLRDLAVERAAEGHRDRGGDRRAALHRLALDDGGQGVDLLGGGGALVGQAEAVGGADNHVGLITAGGCAAVPAAHAWTVNDPAQVGPLLDAGVANVITDDPARIRTEVDGINTLSTIQRLLLRARHALVR